MFTTYTPLVSIMLSLTILLLSPAHAQDSRPSGEMLDRPNWVESSLRIGEELRWYRFYRPKSLSEQAPVVLLLHGGLQSMRRIFDDRAGGTREWADLAESEGFLLVVPNGTNVATGDTSGDRQGWNDGRLGLDSDRGPDDVAFIESLLDRVETTYSVDRARIYVTGASNGGMMTFRLLIEVPARFAAGAAFIANLPVTLSETKKPHLPTPLLIADGTLDPIIKWDGGEILKGLGTVLSVEATVAWWVEANRAQHQNPASVSLPDTNPTDGCRVQRINYPAGIDGAPVVLYTLEGSGHAMPTAKHAKASTGRICREVEGARLAWDFMKGHRRSVDTATPDRNHQSE